MMEADTKIQLEAVISQMIADGEKINVSRVAQKAGVSNALIYNRYPELKLKIQQAKLGRCSLYVLVTVFTPPNNHDFASSLCCSRTRNHAK
jgi:hypothetical protein